MHPSTKIDLDHVAAIQKLFRLIRQETALAPYLPRPNANLPGRRTKEQ